MNIAKMSREEYDAWQARERAAFERLCKEDPQLEREILNDEVDVRDWCDVEEEER